MRSRRVSTPARVTGLRRQVRTRVLDHRCLKAMSNHTSSADHSRVSHKSCPSCGTDRKWSHPARRYIWSGGLCKQSMQSMHAVVLSTDEEMRATWTSIMCFRSRIRHFARASVLGRLSWGSGDSALQDKEVRSNRISCPACQPQAGRTT